MLSSVVAKAACPDGLVWPVALYCPGNRGRLRNALPLASWQAPFPGVKKGRRCAPSNFCHGS